MMRKTFKYRCYPNTGTRRRAQMTMRTFGDIWSNACTERARAYYKWSDAVWAMRLDRENELGRELNKKETAAIRQEASKQPGCSVTMYSQYHLIRKRDHPEYARFYAKAMEQVLAGVDGSYKSYWQLHKKNPDAMPPNQKRFHNCISYRCSGWTIKDNNLFLSGLGKFRLRLHRPIEGKIKTVSITRKNRCWYANFSCEITDFPGACGPVSAPKPGLMPGLQQEHILPGGTDPNLGGAHNCMSYLLIGFPGGTDPNLGGAHNVSNELPCTAGGGTDPKGTGAVDLRFAFMDGLFITDSTGLQIPHPEFYFTSVKRLKRLSRSLSKKKPGSNNRRKARHTLAKHHEHIRNKREYFLWSVARYYALNYGSVTVPKWPLEKKIQYAVSSRAARKLCDSAYGRFVEMIEHKCNELGTQFNQRKDAQWQIEIENLTEVAKREKLSVILRKAKKAVRRSYRGRLMSLETDCEQLTTLQIYYERH